MGKNKPPRNNSNGRHLGMGRQTPVHAVAAQSATWASPGRYAGGTKPGAKTAYWDSISRPFWKRQNYRGRILPGLRVGGHFHCVGAAQGTLWGLLMALFCILIVLVVTQLHEFVKTHRIVHQKVNFTVYKFKMKNFKGNTQNLSFPNYFTVDLCSWDYLCLLYLGGGNTAHGALCFSSHWHLPATLVAGFLLSDVVGVFTPWELGNATDQGLMHCFVDCLDLKWWRNVVMPIELRSVSSIDCTKTWGNFLTIFDNYHLV